MADIFGIGVDVVDIGRIAHLRDRHADRLDGVVFRAEEMAYCLKKPNPDESLAARFAAKEAVMKALGTGWTEGVTFMGIEVVRQGEEKPVVCLHGTTAEKARQLGAGRIHLSMSHGRDSAIAQVIIEKQTDGRLPSDPEKRENTGMLAKWISGKCFMVAVVVLLAWLVASGLGQAVELTGNAARLQHSLLASGAPLASGPNATRYFNSFAGELYPDMMAASISAQREFRRALPSAYSYNQTAHYQDRADLGSPDAFASAGVAEDLNPNSPTTPGSRWVMWDVPFMTKETRKAEDRHLGYNQSTSGFATGFSRLLGDSGSLGLAIGYDQRKLSGRDHYHMKNKADTLHLAIFGGAAVGCLVFDGYAGFSRSWNRTGRSVYSPTGAGYEKNKANFNDTVLSAGFKMSYVWIVPGDVRIVPSVGADFSHVQMGEFREQNWNNQNNASRLHVKKSNYANVQVPVMVSINRTFASSFLRLGGPCSLWTPEFRAGYVPQFGKQRAHASMQLVNSPVAGNIKYEAQSAKIARSYATAGAGLKVKVRDRFIFALDYDVTLGEKYVNHSVTAMYGASF